MRFSSFSRWYAGGIVFAVASLLTAVTLHGQAAPAQAPAGGPTQAQRKLMVEDVFKNVQLLKGITVGEFMDTMGFFAAAVGSNCVHCHTDASLQRWEAFAEDVPRKRRARQMINLMRGINTNYFGGAQVITCNSCHKGDITPSPIPSLLTQYGLPVEDPNIVEIVADPGPSPTATELLDKYIAALGGQQRLAAITSVVGKGTYLGYDTYEQQVPWELFATPGRRTTIIHTQNGDSTYVFDGRRGWTAGVEEPVTLLELDPGAEIDGAKLDADLAIPARIKEALTNWKVGFPPTAIDDKEVRILEGTGAGGTRIKLFFDSETGLLTRSLRYTKTIVGTVPTQIDYSDYKEVNGVKMPHKVTVTWTGGRSFIELSALQANVAIPATRFAQPPPAVVKPPAAAVAR